MADNASMKDQDYSDAPLSEDDPLMELSRIIGLEPRRDSAARREPEPFEMASRAAPVFDPEPVDAVEAPETALEPELTEVLQQDLADELIARLEADEDFSPEADASFDPEPEYTGPAAIEVDPEPVQAREEETAVPHIMVSRSAPASLEDELEALLGAGEAKAAPFGLRPLDDEPLVSSQIGEPVVESFRSEIVEPASLQAGGDDSRIDMNFDVEPALDAVEPVRAEASWAALDEAPAETADEHYEAVEHYTEDAAEFDGAPSWAPVSEDYQAEQTSVSGNSAYQEPAEVHSARFQQAEPFVETVAHEPRAVESTADFEVPEFEYEHPVTAATSDSLDEGYDESLEPAPYAKPLIAADYAAASEPRQFDERDFDQINEAIAELEGERYQPEAGALAAAAAITAAAAAKPAARKEYVLDENDEFAASLDVPPAARPVRPASSGRSYLMAAGLGALALMGGIGAYAWTRGPDVAATSAAPVVLKADAEPVKVLPETPGGKDVPNQDIAVYDKVAGAQAQAKAQDTLVSKAEEPVDLQAKTATRVVLPGPAATETDPAAADAQVAKAEDRIDAAAAAEPSDVQAEVASVAAKKVRTMVVKSDGSLVERPAEPAQADAAPAAVEPELLKSMAEAVVPPKKVQVKPIVAQEAVGAVAAAPAPKDVTVAALEPEAAAPEAKAEAPVIAEEPAAKPVVKTVKTKKITPKPAKVEPVQEVAAASNIPLVDARPSDQPVNIVAKTGKTPTAPVEEAAAAPAVAKAGGNYVIQIASAPSPDQAQSTYASLNRKFGRVIGGRDVSIQKADIPGKGTFYRVRIAAGSKQEAAALCAKYKSAGGQCLVAR